MMSSTNSTITGFMQAKSEQTICSYVRRQGRITSRQRQALETLWPRFGLELTRQTDIAEVFGRRAPSILEIGFGSGEALLATALRQPEVNFIGVEVYRPGIGALLANLADQVVDNVRVINGDAFKVLKEHIPDASLTAIHIFFPDPWPKKRHHKRRLIQKEFCLLMADKLKVGGYLQLATDWEDYAKQMLAVLSALSPFKNAQGEGKFAPRFADRPLTKFEKRGQRLGHQVWDLTFMRQKNF